MGTRRSRHNKGRKPLYKEHRLWGEPEQYVSGDMIAAITLRLAAGNSVREIEEEFGLERRVARKVCAKYFKPEYEAARRARAGARSRARHDPQMRQRLSAAHKEKWARIRQDLGLDGPVEASGTASDILNRRHERSLWGPWRTWSGTELAGLKVLAEADAPIEQVATVFGRRETAIAHQARGMRLKLPAAWAKLISTYKPREPKIVLTYPYIQKARPEHADLLRANDLVPRHLPAWIRADVCQSMMLTLYEGQITLEEVERNQKNVQWFIRKFYKEQMPRQEVTGFSLGDDDDRPYYDAAAAFDGWGTPGARDLNEARSTYDAWSIGGRGLGATQEEDAHEMLLKERIDAWGGRLDLAEDDIRSIYEKSGLNDNSEAARIRLRTMVRRDALFKQQHGRCAYCKCEMTMRWGFPNTVTRDHIIPISAGGLDDDKNIVGACMECNKRKGSMPVQEFLVGHVAVRPA